jgi:chromosome segregation ATPase
MAMAEGIDIAVIAEEIKRMHQHYQSLKEQNTRLMSVNDRLIVEGESLRHEVHRLRGMLGDRDVRGSTGEYITRTQVEIVDRSEEVLKLEAELKRYLLENTRMKKNYQEFEDEIRLLRNENFTLIENTRQSSVLVKQREELEKSNHALRLECEGYKIKIQELMREIALLRGEFDPLRVKLGEAERNFRNQQEILHRKTLELQRISEEYERGKSNRDREKSSYRDDMESLRIKCSEYERTLKQSNERLSMKVKEIEVVMTELDRFKDSHDRLLREKQDLAIKLESYQQYKSRVGEMDGQVALLNTKLTTLASVNKSLDEENKRLMNDRLAMDERMRESMKKQEDLKTTIRELNLKIEKFTIDSQKHHRVSQDVADLKKRVMDKDYEIEKLRLGIERLEKDNSEVVKKLKESDDDNELLLDKIAFLEDSLKKAKTNLRSSVKSEELAKLQTALAEAENELSLLRPELKRASQLAKETRDECDELKRKVTSQDNLITKLNVELDLAKSSMEQLNQRLGEVLTSSNTRIVQLQQTISRVELDLQSSQLKESTLSLTNQELVNSLREAQQSLIQMESELSSTRVQLSQAQTRLRTAEDELKELARLADISSENGWLKDKLKEQAKKIGELEAAEQRLQGELDSVKINHRTEISRLTKISEQWEERELTLSETVRRLQNEIAEWKTMSSKQREENNTLSYEKQELMLAKDQLTRKVTHFEQLYTEVSAELNESRTSHRELSEKLRKLQAEYDSSLLRTSSLEGENTNLKLQVDRFNNLLREEQETRTGQETAIITIRSELRQWQDKYDSLHRENQGYILRLQDTTAVDLISQKLREAEKRITSLEEDKVLLIDQLEQASSALAKEKEAHMKTFQEINQERSKLIEINDRLESQLQESQQRENSLQARLRELASKLEEELDKQALLERELQDKRIEIARLNEESSTLRQTILDLQSELSVARHEVTALRADITTLNSQLSMEGDAHKRLIQESSTLVSTLQLKLSQHDALLEGKDIEIGQLQQRLDRIIGENRQLMDKIESNVKEYSEIIDRLNADINRWRGLAEERESTVSSLNIEIISLKRTHTEHTLGANSLQEDLRKAMQLAHDQDLMITSLKKKIEGLEDREKFQLDQATHWKNEYVILHENNSQLTTSVDNLRIKINELNNTIQTHIQNENNQKLTIEDLQSQLRDKNTSLTKSTQDIKYLQEQLTTLQDEHDHTLSVHTTTITTLNTTISDHLSTITTLNGRIHTLSTDITDLSTRLSTLQSDYAQCKQSLENSGLTIASLRTQIEGLTNTINEYIGIIDGKNSDINQCNHRIGILEGEVATGKKSIGKAEEIIQSLREENTRLANIGSEQAVKITTLQSEIITHTQTISTLQSEILTQKQTISSLNTEILNHNQTIAALNAEILTLKKTIADLKSEILTHNENIASLKAEVFSLSQTISSLKSEIPTHAQSISSLQAEILTHTQTISTLRAEILKYTQTISSLQAENLTHTQTISALKTDIFTQNQAISSLQSENHTHTQTISTLQSEILTLDQTISSLQAEIVNRDKIISTLRAEILNYTQTISSLQSDILTHTHTISTLRADIHTLNTTISTLHSLPPPPIPSPLTVYSSAHCHTHISTHTLQSLLSSILTHDQSLLYSLLPSPPGLYIHIPTPIPCILSPHPSHTLILSHGNQPCLQSIDNDSYAHVLNNIHAPASDGEGMVLYSLVHADNKYRLVKYVPTGREKERKRRHPLHWILDIEYLKSAPIHAIYLHNTRNTQSNRRTYINVIEQSGQTVYELVEIIPLFDEGKDTSISPSTCLVRSRLTIKHKDNKAILETDNGKGSVSTQSFIITPEGPLHPDPSCPVSIPTQSPCTVSVYPYPSILSCLSTHPLPLLVSPIPISPTPLAVLSQDILSIYTLHDDIPSLQSAHTDRWTVDIHPQGYRYTDTLGGCVHVLTDNGGMDIHDDNTAIIRHTQDEEIFTERYIPTQRIQNKKRVDNIDDVLGYISHRQNNQWICVVKDNEYTSALLCNGNKIIEKVTVKGNDAEVERCYNDCVESYRLDGRNIKSKNQRSGDLGYIHHLPPKEGLYLLEDNTLYNLEEEEPAPEPNYPGVHTNRTLSIRSPPKPKFQYLSSEQSLQVSALDNLWPNSSNHSTKIISPPTTMDLLTYWSSLPSPYSIRIVRQSLVTSKGTGYKRVELLGLVHSQSSQSTPSPLVSLSVVSIPLSSCTPSPSPGADLCPVYIIHSPSPQSPVSIYSLCPSSPSLPSIGSIPIPSPLSPLSLLYPQYPHSLLIGQYTDANISMHTGNSIGCIEGMIVYSHQMERVLEDRDRSEQERIRAVDRLDMERREWGRNREMYEQRINDMGNEIEELKKNIHMLNAQIERERGGSGELGIEIRKLTVEIEQLTKDNSLLQQQIGSERTACNHLQLEVTRLTTEIQEVTRESKISQQSLETERAENVHLRQEITRLTQEYDRLSTNIRTLTGEMTTLRTQYSTQTITLTDMKGRLEGEMEANGLLRADAERRDRDNADRIRILSAEIEKYRLRESALEREWSEKINVQIDMVRERDERIALLDRQIGEMTIRMSSSSEDIHKTISTLQADLSMEMSKRQSLEQLFSTLQSERDRLLKDIEDMKRRYTGDIGDRDHRLEQKDIEINELRRLEIVLRDNLSAAKNEVNTNSTIINEKDTRIHDLDAQIRKLSDELNTERRNKDRLTKDLEESRSKIIIIETEISTIRNAQSENTTKQSHESILALEALKKRLAEAEEDRNRLESRMLKMQESHSEEIRTLRTERSRDHAAYEGLSSRNSELERKVQRLLDELSEAQKKSSQLDIESEAYKSQLQLIKSLKEKELRTDEELMRLIKERDNLRRELEEARRADSEERSREIYIQQIDELYERIDSLTIELQQRTVEAEQARRDNELYRERVSIMHNSLEHSHQLSTTTLTQQLMQLQGDVDRYRQMEGESADRLTQMMIEMKNERVLRSSLQSEIEGKDQEIRNLMVEMEGLRVRYKVLTEKNIELQQRLLVVRADSAVDEKFTDVEEEMRRLTLQNDELKRKARDLTEDVVTGQHIERSAVKENSVKINTARGKDDEAAKTIRELREEVDRLRRDRYDRDNSQLMSSRSRTDTNPVDFGPVFDLKLKNVALQQEITMLKQKVQVMEVAQSQEQSQRTYSQKKSPPRFAESSPEGNPIDELEMALKLSPVKGSYGLPSFGEGPNDHRQDNAKMREENNTLKFENNTLKEQIKLLRSELDLLTAQRNRADVFSPIRDRSFEEGRRTSHRADRPSRRDDGLADLNTSLKQEAQALSVSYRSSLPRPPLPSSSVDRLKDRQHTRVINELEDNIQAYKQHIRDITSRLERRDMKVDRC